MLVADYQTGPQRTPDFYEPRVLEMVETKNQLAGRRFVDFYPALQIRLHSRHEPGKVFRNRQAGTVL